VSCNSISKDPFARTIPVKPPTVNKNMKPVAHSIGVVNLTLPPYMVVSQLNIFIPVGTAMIIVAAVK